MRYAVVIVASFLVVVPRAAQADFVIKTAPPRQAVQPVYAPPQPAPRAVYRTPTSRPRPRPPEARPELVRGFGEDVPLSFACRQIVPNNIRVIYGRGVGPKMLVTWKGGDAWGRALAAAVRPLGLHLVVTPGRVEIIR